MKTAMYGSAMNGRSVLRKSGAIWVASARYESGWVAVSGLLTMLSFPSVASATIASGAAERAISAAASRGTLSPVWSHPLSARPRPTDAGTTNSRAVRLRKLSIRCRTSCSFMA